MDWSSEFELISSEIFQCIERESPKRKTYILRDYHILFPKWLKNRLDTVGYLALFDDFNGYKRVKIVKQQKKPPSNYL